VQRHLLGLLFMAIAAALFLLAIYAARQGGAAWVVAIASGALAAWMADLARRALVRRRA
jgi:NADPH-dependent curcumin reductase CurA